MKESRLDKFIDRIETQMTKILTSESEVKSKAINTYAKMLLQNLKESSFAATDTVPRDITEFVDVLLNGSETENRKLQKYSHQWLALSCCKYSEDGNAFIYDEDIARTILPKKVFNKFKKAGKIPDEFEPGRSWIKEQGLYICLAMNYLIVAYAHVQHKGFETFLTYKNLTYKNRKQIWE